MKIMGELQEAIQLQFGSIEEKDTAVDFFNDVIMYACLHTTINAIPTIDDMNLENQNNKLVLCVSNANGIAPAATVMAF